MYCAEFDTGQGRFVAAALGVHPGALPRRRGWAELFAAHAAIDWSIRVVCGRADAPALVFVLAADGRQRAALEAAGADLATRFAPDALDVAGDAEAFDGLAAAVPAHSMRVSHDGFRHAGQPLACEFRLYAAAAGFDGCAYQVSLRRHQPDPERERAVLKYLARLDLDQPFSEPVRAMQRALAERLRRRGWLADEAVACDSAATLERLRGAIERQFAETGGRVGFGEAPLEAPASLEWLATGYHSAREPGLRRELPSLGATLFDANEVDWLVDHALDARAIGAAGGGAAAARRAEVFVSYASSDFARAAQLCEGLEAVGVPCWIAPRDIERALLPYTEAISQAIAQAAVVVVLLSEMANRSVHIPRELDLALGHRLAIVPVRLAKVVPEGQLDYLLRTCQWLDAFDRPATEVVEELLRRLRSRGAP